MPTLMIFPDSKRVGVCRSCKTVITWAVLASGKWHPFDGTDIAEVPQQGELLGTTGRRQVQVDQAKTPSHFATCPDAKKWSRKPKK
jgi:hypothetical protein